jgi:hypothetical protein
MAKKKSGGGMHPSIDSAIDLAQARVNADAVLKTVSENDVDERLLNVCRNMPMGQLGYVLINLDKRTAHFPARDHAVATAFIEKYDAQVRH